MSNHRVFVVIFVVLISTASVAVATGGTTAKEPSQPVTVEQTFIGTSEDSNHAVAVTVTLAPTEETGAINNTVVRLRATESGFIDQSSVSTDESTGGNQVITRRDTSPATFDIGEVQPGEAASISFRVYPKAVLPSGDTLATVTTETQFVTNQRVVSERRTVAPTVNASQAAYTVEPGMSPSMSAGVGAIGSTLMILGVVALYRRRRRRKLCGLLRSAREQSNSVVTKQTIDEALKLLGGSGSDSETNSEPDISDDTPDLNLDD